jgi:hypothetical protein
MSEERPEIVHDNFDFEGLPVPELTEYDPVKMGAVITHAQKQLIEREAPVFQTGGRLVHPVRFDKREAEEDCHIRLPIGALLVRNIAPMRLREYLIEHCAFFKNTQHGAKRIPAPHELVNHILAREDKWDFRVLNGIAEAPTLRSDGSLLQEEGYDERSRLWLDFDDVEFPSIRDKPTRREAEVSLEKIKGLLAEFPFVETSTGESPSRSVALSAILTALVRRSLHSAPAHGCTAPTPGTGKTLIWDCVAQIATGRSIAAISQGRTQEEDEKRIFAVLLEGASVILIDNVAHPVGGEAICTVLTEPKYKGRILGESRSAEVSTNALWLITGNNLTFEGDITRRVILCSMDSKRERPEARTFKIDLKRFVPKHRTELVVAGLTILRAHLAAGAPGARALSPFGSFEQWSQWVRGALVWLGEADPCRTRKYVQADDPAYEAAASLFAAISTDRAGEWFKASDLCTDEVQDCSDHTLWNAVQAVTPNAHQRQLALGHYLKSQVGRIYNGLRLERREDKHAKIFKYRVVHMREVN